MDFQGGTIFRLLLGSGSRETYHRRNAFRSGD